MNEFEKLVLSMRDCQQKYFETRQYLWLNKSKELENKVDDFLRNINQTKLEL